MPHRIFLATQRSQDLYKIIRGKDHTINTLLRTYVGQSFYIFRSPFGYCSNFMELPDPTASVIDDALYIDRIVLVFGCLRKNSTDERTNKPKEEFYSGPYPDRNKVVFFGGSSYNFDLDELLRFSAKEIGTSSFGLSYKIALNDDMTTVVMKRLIHVDATELKFEEQLELIRRVGEHQNVATLHAYHYSKDMKLLFYDYYAAGSLMALLHGNTGRGRTPFAWEARVQIALGTAKGIAHIHSIRRPTLTLGNIKSSNILIDQGEARITDIGLIPLMNITLVQASHSSGYQAPEVLRTYAHTHKSDIYSFGILLLELLTGEKPSEPPSGENLPEWVKNFVREEWTGDALDVELTRSSKHDDKNEMITMLKVAMACVKRRPYERPSITTVVGALEQIKKHDLNIGSLFDENE